MPETLARQSRGRSRPETLADPFGGDQVVVVVIAEHCRLAKLPYFQIASSSATAPRAHACPRPRRSAPDGQQPAAEYGVAVGEDHARPRRPAPSAASARPVRRRPPARRNAREFVVARRVRHFRRPPEPGHVGAAAAPRISATAARIYEGLVVEPGRQQRREAFRRARRDRSRDRAKHAGFRRAARHRGKYRSAAGWARQRRRFRAVPAPRVPRSRRS